MCKILGARDLDFLQSQLDRIGQDLALDPLDLGIDIKEGEHQATPGHDLRMVAVVHQRDVPGGIIWSAAMARIRSLISVARRWAGNEASPLTFRITRPSTITSAVSGAIPADGSARPPSPAATTSPEQQNPSNRTATSGIDLLRPLSP